ncbi:glycosyltransferase family 9 protein [Pseudobacter ginsenosidimutans]|uniref:ADP-heptose:LPS heptosyltransferase n=1 Tax=Pseudobacter ginsenosidimutans TaxID=661488 RepID=A0A4Q7MES2_9BACT|nr:glycosyltransferase family 9 protein [Pseudobacter ginsenosidimutans]QEC42628.1 glycosyltransferase family 9 protein [Pseudobacter ginsenosidimutans]RZS65222.1 ADP-heptose:LPS heptosyltransferase [Pseudobacter ginsenosidimutans]
MKFLIVRFSSIGDIVLTTPVVRCLKKQAVTAEVHYLTKKTFLPVLAANPYIDKIHTLENDLDAVINKLQDEDFDYVIDLHHNLRTLRVKRGLDKQSFSFDKLNIKKWLLTSFKINRMPDVHIVDRYLDTLKSFNIKNDGQGLDYFIPEKDQVKEEDIPASHHAGYIGVVIGAALNTKKYPLHKLKELCSIIDHPIMLLGGKEDREEGDAIAAPDPVKIYNACGKFNINESADLVRRAKLIISNDTGLMHIASAFRKPVISIWGNTVPEFGMYPYYPKAAPGAPSMFDIMEVKGLGCRPCSKIGYDKCPKKHFKCMELTSPESVYEKVKERLGRK